MKSGSSPRTFESAGTTCGTACTGGGIEAGSQKEAERAELRESLLGEFFDRVTTGHVAANSEGVHAACGRDLLGHRARPFSFDVGETPCIFDI